MTAPAIQISFVAIAIVSAFTKQFKPQALDFRFVRTSSPPEAPRAFVLFFLAVAVKKLNLSYYIAETKLYIRGPLPELDPNPTSFAQKPESKPPHLGVSQN